MGTLHHCQVGCADCSVIKSASYTFLVDCHEIGDNADLLPSDKKLQGVFVTHQHYDHFDGLAYLKDNDYSISHLIYSPYERRHNDGSVDYEEWQAFAKYKDHFANKGTKLYAPYRQTQFENPWWKIDGLKFFILGPVSHIAKSEKRELHDACLIVYAELGERRCLFTGDASDINLSYVANNTTDICNDILHASHHGSINGAELDFIKACNASYTVVSTKSGVYENIPSPTAMQRYRDHTSKTVYRTDTDGSLKWTF